MLEAIVAMVIISIFGGSLFLWINSSLASLNRIQEIEAENKAKLNILEYCKQINPMNVDFGSQDFGDYSISWGAKPISEKIDAAGYPAGQGLYQVALYRIDVQVKAKAGGDWFSMHLKQPGFKKVRQGGLPLNWLDKK